MSSSTATVLYALTVSAPSVSITPEDAKEKSHHVQGGFTNPWESWRAVDFHAIRKALGETSNLRATWLGHACYYVEFPGGLRVLFDPVFEDRCSPFSWLGPKRYTEIPCQIKDIPIIDAVVISHNHYDHLSYPTIKEISQRHPNCHFFAPLGNKAWFTDSGIKNMTEMDWWEEREVDLSPSQSSEAKVTDPAGAESSNPADIRARIGCLPCQHTSNRGLLDRGKTLWSSWSIESGGRKLYFAGDTGYRAVPELPDDVDDYAPEHNYPICPAFKDVGKLRGPFDLGLIPIGAYKPRWFMSPMHANPYDAVNIFKDTQCKKALGMHWGTWVLTEEDVLEPPKKLREALRKSEIPEEGIFDVCDIAYKNQEIESQGQDPPTDGYSTEDEEEVLFDLDAEAMRQLHPHLQENMRKIHLERAHRLQREKNDLRTRRYIRDEEREQILLDNEAYRRTVDQMMCMTRHLPEVSSIQSQQLEEPWWDVRSEEISTMAVGGEVFADDILPSYEDLMEQDEVDSLSCQMGSDEQYVADEDIAHHASYGKEQEPTRKGPSLGLRMRNPSILTAVRKKIRKAPVVVMNTNSGERQVGRKAQLSNITAAKTVADIIRSCLGPKAMLKMLLDPMGGIVLTNDGHAILREIEVSHPAAKSMIELSRTQDEEVGDGTTTVIILAGEMLAQALPQLERNIHPVVIISAFKRALADALAIVEEVSIPVDIDDDKAMRSLIQSSIGTKFVSRWSDLMCDLALTAVRTVSFDAGGGKREVDIKRYARIEKIPGGQIEDSEVIDGVMVNKDITHPKMRRRIENPRIVLLDCPLEYKKGESQTNIEVSKEDDWNRILQIEEEQVKQMCEAIVALKPDVVITEKGVSDLAQHFLMKADITALRRVRKTDNNRIARATGATIVNRVDDIQESDVGTECGLFEIEKIGDEYFTFMRKCKNPKACTILLRGPSKDIINEVDRNLQDAMSVARNVIFHPRLSPGGGAIEMAVSVKLSQLAKSIEGVQQWPYKAVADAMEVIPRTLAQNAGASPIRVLTRMRAKHVEGQTTWGLDGDTGALVDMKEYGVWEPEAVKLQSIKTAVESACLLLRVDDICSGKSAQQASANAGGGDE
ncbi:T-complex protein 1 subunit gamma [Aspergillus nanangensis]|uniref:T-complex protein 1 subunit gamma n=1 Tax=Aspergillus nanangensis TaxID=2582783 RepID=A0AAD4CVB5_ASPNN|nr:T-complex protein 1 subunit gamma [Aspergillus nanangensis]